MKDRALELALALMLNPSIDPSIRYVIERLVNKWHDEDVTAAKDNERVE